MFKTIALAAALIAAPAAASTYSLIAIDNVTYKGPDQNFSFATNSGGNVAYAEAVNISGSNVEAVFSGTGDGSAYASTRYQYDAPLSGARQVKLDAFGYYSGLGLGHGKAIIATWQLDALGDAIWQDYYELDSCGLCDVSGYAAFSLSWTRLVNAGESLFLTITAQSYTDTLGPLPSVSSFGAFEGRGVSALASVSPLRQAHVLINRDITIEAIAGVPEPGSWAMLIAGFGLAGAALRRQRGMARTVAA